MLNLYCMAFVNNNIFDLSGKLGNVIFRNRNGKLVAYSVPKHHRISKSEKSINNRKKFGINVELSKNICSLKPLYSVWKNSYTEGSNPYTRIMKFNYNSSEPGRLTLNNSLTPISIALDVTSVTITNGVLDINFQIPNHDNNNLISPFYINIIVFLCDTKEGLKVKGTRFITFNVPILKKEETGIYNFRYTFDRSSKGILQFYSKGYVYFALVNSENFESKPVWSTSYSEEVPIA
jgi:hypothetical protein